MSLDSVIAALSPVSYLSDLTGTITDTGSLGLTGWGTSTDSANIVPSESTNTPATNSFFGTDLLNSMPSATAWTAVAGCFAYKHATASTPKAVLFASDKLGNGRDCAQLFFNPTANTVEFWGGGGGTEQNASFTFVAGQTYWIVFSFDNADKKANLWINGVQILGGTQGGTGTVNRDWLVYGDGYGLGQKATGNWQRLAIFDHGLAQSDADALWAAFQAPLVASTLAENYHTASTAILTWDSPVGGVSPVVRQLQVSPSGAGTWTDVSGATNSPGRAIGLANSTAYDFRVLATDADSNTAASNTVTITTDAASVTVVQPLCNKIANFASVIAWTTTLGETVDVLLSTDGGSTFPITLASGVPAQQGFARFWLESSYIASTCRIRVTDGTTSDDTTDFAIVADTTANLQPTVTIGSNNSPAAPTDPGGTGAVPNYGYDIVPNQTWSGIRAFGVATLSARTDAPEATDTSPGVETVAIRANEGAWTYIPLASLNQDVVKAVRWTPDAYPFDNSSFPLIRAVQEFCAKFDSSGLPANSKVVVQAIVFPYVGKPRVLPDIAIWANPSGGSTYYVSASGTSGGAGTRADPIDTIFNTLAAANTAGVVDGLTIVMLDGDHKLQFNAAEVATNRPISIVADEGAWDTTRIVSSPGDLVYFQITGTVRFECRVDFSDSTGTMSVTNQTQNLWFDGAEILGPGGDVTMAASFNGVTNYLTECLVRDVGSVGGGAGWETSGVVNRNVYALRAAGIVGNTSQISLNFTIREHGQFNEQHSDVYAREPSLNQVVISTIADRCYRPFAGVIFSAEFSWAMINCDFMGIGTENANGTFGQDIFMAYLRTNHATHHSDFAAWAAGGGQPGGVEKNQQIHANIFESGVVDTSPYLAGWTNNDFGTGGTIGTGATNGSTLSWNTDRTPVDTNTSFSSGLPVWPYDALNRRRGLYSANHATARGPYAQAAEYTAPESITYTPDRATYALGATVSIHGITNWAEGTTATVQIKPQGAPGPVDCGTGTIGADGTVTISATIPTDNAAVTAGSDYFFQLTDGSDIIEGDGFTVVAAGVGGGAAVLLKAFGFGF